MMGALAVAAGAALGALLRWWLGMLLNPVFPVLPLGTLAVNVLGGYGIGLAIAYFAAHPGIAPEYRLFAITGFLGGFTTFSTFSAEVVTNFSRGLWGWGVTQIGLHLAGSLLGTVAGLATLRGYK